MWPPMESEIKVVIVAAMIIPNSQILILIAVFFIILIFSVFLISRSFLLFILASSFVIAKRILDRSR
jgi:hypothetical protein